MNSLRELLKDKPALDLWLKAREPMIGMKFRQKGMSETRTELLKKSPVYLFYSEVGPLKPRSAGDSMMAWNEAMNSKMVIGVDWARDEEKDRGIAVKLQEWLLKKQRERGMELLAAACARGEEQGWSRPVIINPARPELVMLPALPPLPEIPENRPASYMREHVPWACPNHVLLDESLRQWFRRPRSKKKRIRSKWKARFENWRPSPVIYGVHLVCGKNAMRFGYGTVSDRPASGSPAGRTFLMHPLTWEKLKRQFPDVAATCSVNLRSSMMMKKF